MGPQHLSGSSVSAGLTASGVRPLACIRCAANVSQASLRLCILKYQTAVSMTEVERDKGLNPHSFRVKKIFSTEKDLLCFLPVQSQVMQDLSSTSLSFAPELL